jgi:hypothetical protein
MADKPFIGFTYNGIHSDELKICRTSTGDRYEESVLPTMQDKVVDIPGGNGQYYFGTVVKSRTFPISFAFDSLTTNELATLKKTLSDMNLHTLTFDERPSETWMVKPTGNATLKYLCFEENGVDIYKGEGQITFITYSPYPTTSFNESNLDPETSKIFGGTHSTTFVTTFTKREGVTSNPKISQLIFKPTANIIYAAILNEPYTLVDGD